MENDIDPSESFKIELNNIIKRRKKYERLDFKLAHLMLWLSILASFSSAIIIADGEIGIPKIVLAIISGIPGLVVVIEKSFDFAKRSVWGTMYKIDLQELQDEIDFKKLDPSLAAKKLRQITRRNEMSFLKIGFFAREKEEPKLSH